jgi:hypothetical protein
LDSGSLPAGLSLSSGGVISGTPTGTGTSNFTVRVADSDGVTGSSDEDTQALSITVNAAPSTAFVTGQTLGSLRNDYSNWVGFRFTVGSSNITVGELGRWVVSGNSGTHTVKLVLASTGADVSGGTVSIATSGATAGQFKYVALGSSVTLLANTTYYIVSQESNGGDQWYDLNTTLTSTSVATINSPVYGTTGAWSTPSGAGQSFVPVSFKY